MTEKRKVYPPGYRPSVSYGLFFEESVNKYFRISTSSTLWPKNLDLTTVSEMDRFVLRDGNLTYDVRYITHSTSESEIEMKIMKLQKALDDGKVMDSNASFSFLDSSIRSEPQMAATASARAPISDRNHETTRSIPEEDLMNETTKRSTINSVPEANEMQQLILLQKENNRLLKERNQGQARLRRTLNKYSQTSEKKPVQCSDDEQRPSKPVYFQGTNLVKLGARNLDICQYGTLIARKLWDDESLKTCRLLPSRVKGRPSLSPTRSNIWLSAMKHRFSIDDTDEIKPAITAVNQLGSDLALGKRKRPAHMAIEPAEDIANEGTVTI